MSRSVRTRALTRAARAWEAGKPHTALMELRDAGCGDLWPEFQAEACRRARRRFKVQMMDP